MAEGECEGKQVAAEMLAMHNNELQHLVGPCLSPVGA